MNCSVCGGKLRFADGIYVCENCGNKQTIASFFENTEVYLCYVETDESGKRTKDSIMAQNLYHRIQALNINTFYQRISAGDLTGVDFLKACEVALNSAKIILIIGTSGETFKRLLSENGDKLTDRTVIPVYSDMDTYALPEELSKLQAMNYDSIGAAEDLTKSILQALGRGAEIDVIKTQDMRAKRKKRNVFFASGIALALIAFCCIYIVFGTPYVLKSKKYDYAQRLTENGERIKAIAIYSELGNYKNSPNAMKSIYNQYNGYFNNDDNTLCLHLNIDSDMAVEIEIMRLINNDIIKVDASALIDRNTLSFAFKDSENNSGSSTIELCNNGIKLIVETDSQNDFSIGNIEYTFKFENRSDAPLSADLTKDELIHWAKSKITASELKKKGYEPIFEAPIEKMPEYSTYIIKDTDIKVALYAWDISKYEGWWPDDDDDYVDDMILFGVSAPAQLIIPDKVGNTSEPFIENDILYFPNGKFGTSPGVIGLWTQEPINVIEKDTPVGFVAKSAIGPERWDLLVEDTFNNIKLNTEHNSGDASNEITEALTDEERSSFSLYD